MSSGVKKLIGGGILFFGGAVLVPILIVVPLILDKSAEPQFLAPGTITVEVKEPGKYYLWNHYQTVFEGTSFNRPEHVPDGLEISIVDATGKDLTLVSNTSISSNVGSSAKRTIGHVEVAQPGPVEVTVVGEIDAPCVFSFAPTKIWRILGMVMAGIVVSGIVCLAGGGLLIWGVVELATEKGIKQEPVT